VTHDRIERHRVRTGQQNSQLFWLSALSRPLSLHGQDAVKDCKLGFDSLADPYQERSKKLAIDSGPQMPLRLPQADNASEGVLHREGQQHLGVGFEFRQVDQDVGVEGVAGDLELPKWLTHLDRH